MPYDLLIKNGVLVDGSGLPRYHADVAVQHKPTGALPGRLLRGPYARRSAV